MKKTLIALMALAGVACGFENVELSFDGSLTDGFTWQSVTTGSTATYVESGLQGYGQAIVFDKSGFVGSSGDYSGLITGTKNFISANNYGTESAADVDFSVVTTVKFEAWAEYVTGGTAIEHRIFLFGSNNNNGAGLGWFVNNGNMGITIKAESHNALTASPALELNTWYTLALTYDSASNAATFYVNGTNVGSLTFNNHNYRTPGVGLGVGSGSGAGHQGIWNGAMADYKLFNSTLTAEQVAAYGAPVAAPSIPEPATATLSLLALCGLASRRRRH